jgi:Transmembrane exosortase (Exosortase_EpsH)
MSVVSIQSPRLKAVQRTVLLPIAVLALVLGFRGAPWQLVQRWTGQEEYSHGFLIVVVAAWLLWTRRHEGIFAF